MKKKVILLLVLVVLTLLAMTACTKTFDVSKLNHDDIFDVGIDEYIAVDNGKYFLCSINKTRLITTGFDSLKYIDENNDQYLFAYNAGDAGYSVIRNDGKILISSTKEVKITAGELIYDTALNENNNLIYNYYGILIDYVNEKGILNTALYTLNGEQTFIDEFCNVEIIKNKNSEIFSINYIFCNILNEQGNLIARKVLNKTLSAVYEISFEEDKELSSWQTFSSKIGYLAYTETVSYPSGLVIPTVYYDIYCQDVSYTRYDSVNSINTYGNGVALFAKKGAAYALFNENGIVKEFSQNAIAENNNIKISKGNGKFDIYRYDGSLMLEQVSQNTGSYIQDLGGIQTCYSYEGKELFSYDTEQVLRTETKRFVTLNIISEAVKIIDKQNKVSYKFFVDGVLKKEYNTDYQYLSDANGVYIFYTLKDSIQDYYYYYNAYSGDEFVIKADPAGVNTAYLGTILNYKYFTQKNSKNICFYENASAVLTPYQGFFVPGYARQGGYFAITHQSFTGSKAVVLKMEFDIYKVKKVNGNDIYTDIKERNYAYYVVTDTGKGANIEHIYSGLSKMTVDFSSEHKLLCFSAVDRFANANLYLSFDRLENKTLIYDVSQNESSDIITLAKRAEIGKCNMAIYNDKYLIGTDYKNNGRNFVYTTNGNKVIDSNYYISEINGNLAIINYVNPNQQNSFGVYDLLNNKVIEKCNNNFIDLLDGGYYAIGKIDPKGVRYAIKDSKKSIIKSNVLGYELVCERYDTEGNKNIFYKMNLGNKQKLLKVIVK